MARKSKPIPPTKLIEIIERNAPIKKALSEANGLSPMRIDRWKNLLAKQYGFKSFKALEDKAKAEKAGA